MERPVWTPDSDITVLRGISESRAAQFRKAGVSTLSDLTDLFPRRYELRGRVIPLMEAVRGTRASFLCTVVGDGKVVRLRHSSTLLTYEISDGSGRGQLRFFNCIYRKKQIVPGSVYRLYGTVLRTENGLPVLINPSVEPYSPDVQLPAVVPVYPTREGLSQSLIRSAERAALPVVFPPSMTDPLPLALCMKYHLANARFAAYAIHFPQDEAELDAARRRIMFEELLVYALRLSARRRLQLASKAPPMEHADLSAFYASLPYQLTGAQMRAIADFAKDMTEKPYPMNRALFGDVGSGKTVCAAAAAVIALQNGYQAALMAPTELLAQQHYESLGRLLAPCGIRPALLTGSLRKAEKEQLKAEIASGAINLIIGTHTLLYDDVQFHRLGLVILDEQQRFGVLQRAALEKKAANTHVLMMSATPIPRTLEMLARGQIDRSDLDEMPPGRLPVRTHLLGEEQRTKLYRYMADQVHDGYRVYVVCPSIDDGDCETDMPRGFSADTVLHSAVSTKELLESCMPPDVHVGLLHGKMKAADKDGVMRAFADGDIGILVSTTVVEVGVDVPQATVMVIENAERFGLSQLHQLRGRVGRGGVQSHCFLLSAFAASAGEKSDAAQRLTALCQMQNGAEIAEKDLQLRGPGDFFSAVRESGIYPQSGALQFAFDTPSYDTTLWHDAFEAAEAIMQEDPFLQSPAYRMLGKKIEVADGVTPARANPESNEKTERIPL